MLYKKRKRGLTLPGYNYLGPFNSEDNGEPTNESDRVAKRHDQGYKLLQLSGRNPYIEWNNADAEAQRQWGHDWGGRVARGAFALKRTAAKAGLLRDESWVQKKPKVMPLLKTQATTEMPDGKGSGNKGVITETSVDPVPFDVHRGPPNYTYASLPYLEDRWEFTGTATGTAVYARDHWFRLTSPYDPAITVATTDSNTGAGTLNTKSDTVTDVIVRKADWFDFYAGLYKYYHVVACRWNVTIENQGEPIWVYQMFANDERPPVLASNLDMQTWSGVKHKYVNSTWKAVTTNGFLQNGDNIANDDMDEDEAGDDHVTDQYGNANVTSRSGTDMCSFSGIYRPGDYNRDIRLDSEVENWTAINTNPLLPERLLIRVKPQTDAIPDGADGLDFGDTLKYRIRTHLEYLVEFKELNTGLKYPVQRQPLTVTIATNTASDL